MPKMRVFLTDPFRLALIDDEMDQMVFRLNQVDVRPNGEPVFDALVMRRGGPYALSRYERIKPSKVWLDLLRRVLPSIHGYRQSKFVLRRNDLVYVLMLAEKTDLPL